MWLGLVRAEGVVSDLLIVRKRVEVCGKLERLRVREVGFEEAAANDREGVIRARRDFRKTVESSGEERVVHEKRPKPGPSAHASIESTRAIFGSVSLLMVAHLLFR